MTIYAAGSLLIIRPGDYRHHEIGISAVEPITRKNQLGCFRKAASGCFLKAPNRILHIDINT
jgi:hypothetical protein